LVNIIHNNFKLFKAYGLRIITFIGLNARNREHPATEN